MVARRTRKEQEKKAIGTEQPERKCYDPESAQKKHNIQWLECETTVCACNPSNVTGQGTAAMTQQQHSAATKKYRKGNANTGTQEQVGCHKHIGAVDTKLHPVAP
jgi:hypothetical protein